MADTCIVCLETLGEEVDVPESGSDCQDDAGPVAASATPHPSNTTTQQTIASIKPCNHFLHDVCLREWSQKANSCPICRAAFNKVEVLDKVGGKFTPPVLLRISFVASSASWFYYCKLTVWVEGFFFRAL